jgi:hypothetical protein
MQWLLVWSPGLESVRCTSAFRVFTLQLRAAGRAPAPASHYLVIPVGLALRIAISVSAMFGSLIKVHEEPPFRRGRDTNKSTNKMSGCS